MYSTPLHVAREEVEAGLLVALAARNVLARQRAAGQRAVRQKADVALPRRAHLRQVRLKGAAHLCALTESAGRQSELVSVAFHAKHDVAMLEESLRKACSQGFPRPESKGSCRARQQTVRILDADDFGQAQLLGKLAEARDAPAGLVADPNVPHLPANQAIRPFLGPVERSARVLKQSSETMSYC